MTDQLIEQIPSLDLADFTQGTTEQKTKFVQALGKAYEAIGFVAIKNHGLDDYTQNKLYESIKAFFNLSEEEKMKYSYPELAGQRGYTAKNTEHAKGRTVADLKEFYQIGQTVEDDENLKKEYPNNIFPESSKEFEEFTLKTYRTLENAGREILKAIALFLDLDENYFEDKVHHGNSILRAIHYFPLSEDVPAGAVRAAEHGDINLITLLMGASAEGLEVQRRDGKWIPITALPEQIIVNVGDMLDRLTNHKLKSTIHRVVNPKQSKEHSSRYSIPFFLHPKADMDLTSLENCIDESNPKRYEDITAGEFLEQRLAEIGLKKEIKK